MEFDKPLIEGILVKRYKRFLADIELSNGSVITAHTPNTGSMKGCAEPGSRVWLRDTCNPNRKYRLSWEMVETFGGWLVGINTGLANQLVREAIEQGTINELSGYSKIRREVRYGVESSRIDLLLEAPNHGSRCYVEVKNVTLFQQDTAFFPDAVSTRATKHLRELATVAECGHRAVIFFCIQRQEVKEFHPADFIDSVYGKTLRKVLARGVEAMAYCADISPTSIRLSKSVPVICP